MLQSKDKEWQTGLKKKKEPTICCLKDTHFRTKDTHRLKIRGWKKIFHKKEMTRKWGLQYSDKVDFKRKAIKKEKEGHCIMIKGSIQKENITVVNIYAPNIGAPK